MEVISDEHFKKKKFILGGPEEAYVESRGIKEL